MTDPENFMGQERAEAREARTFERRDPLTGLWPAVGREERDPYSGEWRPVPSRAELTADRERSERERRADRTR